MVNRISRRDALVALGKAGFAGVAAATPGPGGGQSERVRAARPMAGERPGDRAAILAYFETTAPLLLRPAQGILSAPSIAPSLPGKQYNAQLWDWDTLWTARGLFAFARMKKDDAFRGKVAEHAKGSLLDFLAQQSAEGRVPTMMNPTNPDHFGSLDPTHNQAKPVMAQLALLIADETGDAGWATPLLEKLVAFHAAWLKTNRSQIGLLVWSNGIGLGNDNDPTSSGRPPFSSANPLLNCMFYEDLRAVAELAGRLGMSARRDELAAQADAFGKLIQTAQWDPRDKFFYTQDVLCSDDRAKYLPNAKEGMAFSWKSLPLRIATFTGFLPLWVGVATAAQAKALLDTWWRGDDRFHAAYGCRTLSDRETMYELVYSGNPSDWLGPIWTIANYLVWRGLKKYGTAAEADELAQATIRMLAKDLAEHGSLNEYYHPDTGEALSHAGFMDWNLLVLEMMG